MNNDHLIELLRKSELQQDLKKSPNKYLQYQGTLI